MSDSGEAFITGEPEIRGEVNGLVCWGERGGPRGVKRSSENMSVKRVDFESVLGEVGEMGE